MNDKQLIQPYKLGAITTDQFLQNLLQIFPFLNDIDTAHEALAGLNDGESYSHDQETWKKRLNWVFPQRMLLMRTSFLMIQN
jgi:hypothetical protein